MYSFDLQGAVQQCFDKCNAEQKKKESEFSLTKEEIISILSLIASRKYDMIRSNLSDYKSEEYQKLETIQFKLLTASEEK